MKKLSLEQPICILLLMVLLIMPFGLSAEGFDDCEDAPQSIAVAPPDITVTCDLWIPFDPRYPETFTDEFDELFGYLRAGTSNRQKIYVLDRVCTAHPRFSEYAPSNPSADPCYEGVYNIYWGLDGYTQNYDPRFVFQRILDERQCGRGKFVREWSYYNPNGPAIARQEITIIDCKEFYVPALCWRNTPGDVGTCDVTGLGFRNKLVEWPCDVELDGCTNSDPDQFLPDNLNVRFEEDRQPRLDDDRCSMIAATFEDRRFTLIDGSCIKIFRDWKVIDWCLYEDYVRGLYFGEYEWEYTQVIKLANSEGPKWSDCEDRVLCGYGNPNDPAANQCSGEIELRASLSDDCTPADELRVDYKIDLFNDGTPDLLGYNVGQGDVYPFPNPDNLPVRTFADTLPEADGVFPVGIHKILWGAEDGCGNSSVCSYLFEVEDCKPPTPYCRLGITTTVHASDTHSCIILLAHQFNLNSYDNCTAEENLRYSFSADINDTIKEIAFSVY